MLVKERLLMMITEFLPAKNQRGVTSSIQCPVLTLPSWNRKRKQSKQCQTNNFGSLTLKLIRASNKRMFTNRFFWLQSHFPELRNLLLVTIHLTIFVFGCSTTKSVSESSNGSLLIWEVTEKGYFPHFLSSSTAFEGKTHFHTISSCPNGQECGLVNIVSADCPHCISRRDDRL